MNTTQLETMACTAVESNHLSNMATCPSCGGSGTKGCSSCGGTGKMNPADPYSLSCSFCGGDGSNNCGTCGGSGQV
jgi:hypothetical protein